MMDDAGLIEVVESALAAGANLAPQEQSDHFSILRSLTMAQGADEAIDRVRIAVENHPNLKELQKSFFWPGLSPGGVGILPVHLAHWVVARALLEGGDAATAVKALSEFAAKNEVDGIRVLVAHGAILEDDIGIDDATWIVPLSRIFSSIGTSQLWRALHSVGVDGREVFAVVQRFKMQPAVRSDFERAPGWTVDHEREFRRLEYFAYSLALLPGTAINVISRWVDIAEVGAIPGLSGGALGELSMEILPKRGFPSPLQLLKPADVMEAARGFASLPTGDQTTCYISLNRLALAAARRRDEDRAIELGVSLEAIFGQDQRGELTHKVSVRAALFVGDGLEEQRSIRKLIKDAYGMRSDVVHTGRFSSKRNPESLALVADTTRRALRKIVARGGMPNWDDVDLGQS